jgi:hypothetical protein
MLNAPRTVTSSNTPLNSGVTRLVYGGGGLYVRSGSLIGSDATRWYFGPGSLGLIEDGIDLDNDGGVRSDTVDIPPFSGSEREFDGMPIFMRPS